MTKVFSIVLSLILVLNTSAQETSKDVTITASGSGTTMEEAQRYALRSATEQAFGAFISSKTEIFNDQIVADEISSVSSGNIKSFEILNQAQLPDGRWGCTLKALVSVDKLTSFVQAKGVEIEFKGGLFALNIKQQILNEQGETEAVYNMVGLLHETMQISFDYEIKSGDPKSLDSENKNWEIPLTVTATCNKNIDFCANYFKKTLAALSLSSAELESYKSLDKQVFPIVVNYQNEKVTYHLRKKASASVICSFATNWNYYTRNFTVQSGVEKSYGKGKGNEFSFTDCTAGHTDGYGRWVEINNFTTINFPTSGIVAGTFKWNDKRTLIQIEQMTGYSIKSLGTTSKFKNGGYVVYERDGHGLVVCQLDHGNFDYNRANVICDSLVFAGYSDWHLPSKEELETIYNKLFKVGIGKFKQEGYWSNSEKRETKTSEGSTGRPLKNEFTYAYAFDFNNGKVNCYKISERFLNRSKFPDSFPAYHPIQNVRAVRYF